MSYYDLFSYLHSHVWCSTNVISTYSCPGSDGLIFNSWGTKQVLIKSANNYSIYWSYSNREKKEYLFASSHLHGDVCGVGGMALQVLVPTATCTPDQWYTGRAVDVLHLCWVFLNHLHQLLNGPTEAPTPHVLERQHCGREEIGGSIQFKQLPLVL